MAHPSIISVVRRLGVSLGVGDDSIGAICRRLHIDSVFFLSVVNTYIDENYFPVDASDTFTLEKTIDYLRKTASYYLRVQIPNIDRHFNSLMERSGGDNNLSLLQRFFIDMRSQLMDCLDYDEKYLYPALLEGHLPDSQSEQPTSHDEVEEKLHDLLTFFVVHLQGSYDSNLCMAVVSAIFSLEKDVRQNNRIRNRILLPLANAMHKRDKQ